MLPTPRSCIAVAAALLLGACGDELPRADEGRGILIVAVDGLRADHVGHLGYDRETTPVLDALAELGVSFTQAFSTAPWSLPAHASLLTGCEPGVSRRILPAGVPASTMARWLVPDAAPKLAQELLRNGYATAAFADDPLLDPVRGLGAGFQTFVRCRVDEDTRPSDLGLEAVSVRFEQWLRQLPRQRNWFAYLQVQDLERTWRTNDPLWDTYFQPREELSQVPPVGDAERIFFAVPRPRWSGGMHTLGEYQSEYDGAIRRLDRQLGRMLTHVRQMGRLEGATVVVVGTHGMGFGEAGLILDHGTLSDVDLRVPLIVKPPEGAEPWRGARTDALASLVDVAPTLLDLEGLRVPAGMQGLSLAGVLRRGGPSPRRHAFARGGYQDGVAVMDARWCLEYTLPWRVDQPALLRSWYGSDQVDPREPRLVLHDRRAPGDVGHARGAPLEPEVVDPLRKAAALWLGEVERVRRAWQEDDWLVLQGHTAPEDELPLGPLAGELPPPREDP